jgi:hypothetical protein
MLARGCGNAMPRSVANRVDPESRILMIRGLSVLLDADLAALYGVSTGALLQAVRRNPERFPADFMFQLSNQELAILKSQTVISSSGSGHGGRRALPYAFTEQGVAMLSSVLRGETAVRVNVEIMRAFVRLRRAAAISAEVLKLIEDLASRVDSHDGAIAQLVEAIQALADSPPASPSRPIGFTADVK